MKTPQKPVTFTAKTRSTDMNIFAQAFKNWDENNKLMKPNNEFKLIGFVSREWCENIGTCQPQYVFTKEELDNAEKHSHGFIKELYGTMYYLNPPLFKIENENT
jgi:hypothetical protein